MAEGGGFILMGADTKMVLRSSLWLSTSSVCLSSTLMFTTTAPTRNMKREQKQAFRKFENLQEAGDSRIRRPS